MSFLSVDCCRPSPGATLEAKVKVFLVFLKDLLNIISGVSGTHSNPILVSRDLCLLLVEE